MCTADIVEIEYVVRVWNPASQRYHGDGIGCDSLEEAKIEARKLMAIRARHKLWGAGGPNMCRVVICRETSEVYEVE